VLCTFLLTSSYLPVNFQSDRTNKDKQIKFHTRLYACDYYTEPAKKFNVNLVILTGKMWIRRDKTEICLFNIYVSRCSVGRAI
jgi:hypothetical protein